MTVLLDRRCIRAAGPDAVAYLQSMVSNDVEQAARGGGVYALLLTPKARVIADLEIYNTGEELVVAAPAARRDDVLAALARSRFRRKVELEPSEHAVVWGDDVSDGLARLQMPDGPHVLVARPPDASGDPAAREVARIEAGLPAYGHEFDGDSMPAEAGLDELAVSFTKGCYPGQEPVARLHYRGHANRGVRGLRFGDELPAAGAVVRLGDREVGRVTSVVRSPRMGGIGLGILRREVEDGAEVLADGVPARVGALPFG